MAGSTRRKMTLPYRAVAFDYDGTLTSGGRPRADLLDALAAARRGGLRIVLVTGRILDHLRAEFPDVAEHFDAIVAENGAVLVSTSVHQLLASPIPGALSLALAADGVPVDRGEVLLACAATDGERVLRAVRQLGVDAQLVFNREAMMILPTGVSKATGLRAALDELGIAPLDTVAVGDAENDHAMFDACGLGIAVANAVAALQRHADLVVPEPDADGAMIMLRDVVAPGCARRRTDRWSVVIGRDTTGAAVRVPVVDVNVLVVGASHAGKSYVAGLLAEGLVAIGCSTLIVDFEGDHTGLAGLPGVVAVGGEHTLPAPAEVVGLLRGRLSVVVDLCLLAPVLQDRYATDLLAAAECHRSRTGLPHWIVIDEAHRPYAAHAPSREALVSKGHCYVTWLPEQLDQAVVDEVDVVIARSSVAGRAGADPVAGFLDRWAGPSADAALPVVGPNHAVWYDRSARSPRRFALAGRRVPHVRHWHKYAQATLPAPLHFALRGRHSVPTGQVAANATELHRLLQTCADDVVDHHCRHGDFSGWAAAALHDSELAASLGAVERAHHDVADAALTRARLTAAIERRYLA